MEKKTSDRQRRKGRRSATPTRGYLGLVITAVCLGMAIVSFLCFVVGKYREFQAQQIYELLAQQTDFSVREDTPLTVLEQIAEPIPPEFLNPTPSPTPPPVEEIIEEPPKDPMEILAELGVPVPEDKVVDFEMLREQVNKDIYAWIYIPGTNIDYPVLRHPTDNGYYLMHNLDGSKGYPGCIYSENFNSTDWLDPMTLLYGHDMRSTDSMFHQLHKFEKEKFFEENQYIYIYTPERLFVYQIFASVVRSDEHVLMSHDFYDREQFAAYFEEVKNASGSVDHQRTECWPGEDGKVLALSTCIKNKPSNRYLVYGILLNE